MNKPVEENSENGVEYKKVMIVMGSKSDWPTMKAASSVLTALGVDHQSAVVSAHRTPERMYEFARDAENRGTKVIIAGAGGAAHLPGMIAAISALPVVAVPVKSKFMDGIDSLLSIAQMPRGVAVATQGVGEMGAYNAGIYAAQILASSDEELFERFKSWRLSIRSTVGWEVE